MEKLYQLYDPDMATPAPKAGPPPWPFRLWKWYTAHNFWPRVSLALGVVSLFAAATCVGFWIWSKHDGSVDANSLVGFAGGIVGAVLGGLAAVLVLRLSLRHEKHEANEAKEREIGRRRMELANQIGELVDPADGVADGLHKRRQFRRLLGLMAMTWRDQHEGRHVVEPLTRSLAAFDPVMVESEYGPVHNSRHLNWVQDSVQPAIVGLMDAVAHEVLVGTETPAGIPPTALAAQALREALAEGSDEGWL